MVLKSVKFLSSIKRVTSAKIKIILFILLFFMLAALAGFYFYEKLTSVKKAFKEIKVDSDASLLLNSMQHTSTRNGVKEWTLKASSAKLLKNEAKALIVDISLVFFLKNGEEAFATSKKGYINTKENDIELYDNVIIQYRGSILKTDQLHYEKKSHIIYSNEHITVTNNSSYNNDSTPPESIIESDSMKIDINKNTLELKGNVYAIISESLVFSQ
ncbi:MAG: LPS export ABC transporter periplasmic protein LptC [Desulfamplus sp.]|nr:LPS export ABC transporter periplasmic protein LptC [Desulfamplus sp.]